MSTATLNNLFTTEKVDRSFRQAVPRRGSPVRPYPILSFPEAELIKSECFTRFGLEEYVNCWSGEMAKRPIPFVSTDKKPLLTQQIFERYFPSLLNYILPHITPSIQTINKISALGYPINGNPGDGMDRYGIKQYYSKFDVVLEYMKDMELGAYDIYKSGYHTIGKRLQNEPPSKIREFQFINDAGDIYQEQIDAAGRVISVPDLGPMIGSRTRTIVRPPIVNLWLQCWDTLFHNALMSYPLMDSNIYTKEEWPRDSNFVTFDCKHYERYLGLCAISYARIIGGQYGEQLLQLIHYPFIVPTDSWKNFYLVRPQYKPGIYPQFSSGLSPVAPLGKCCKLCVDIAYFCEVKHMDITSAIATTLSGTSPGMRRWSYGDDNRLLGEKSELDQYYKFQEQFLELERDESSRKYLGVKWRPDLGRWLLPAETYLLKGAMPERDFEWKDYPYLGLVERRKNFIEYGEPEIGADIIPFEDELWEQTGHPFIDIIRGADSDRLKALKKGVQLSTYLVTDKEYAMSEQQKESSGLFWHLKPNVVAGIVAKIIDPVHVKKLNFQNIRFEPVPSPDTRKHAFTLFEGDNASESELYAE